MATESEKEDEGQESVAKDQAASVVLAYREVDWDAVAEGDGDAVDQLVRACERHEVTARYLEEDSSASTRSPSGPICVGRPSSNR